MKVEGSHEFAAPRDVVWPMLLDPVVLAQILPDCERLEQVGENQYEGAMKIKIGPVQGTFDGTIALSDLQEPESATIAVTGQGAPGFVNGTGHMRLEENGDGSILRYEGDAQIGGRLAAVGQRLLDASTRAIIRTGLDGLDGLVAATGDLVSANGPGPERAPTPADSPSRSAFTFSVVRHMIRDALGGPEREAQVGKALRAAGVVLILYGLCRWIRRRRPAA